MLGNKQVFKDGAKHRICYEQYFADAIRLALSNSNFCNEDFTLRRLLLCESYCLLWYQSVGGNCEGLYADEELKHGMFFYSNNTYKGGSVN